MASVMTRTFQKCYLSLILSDAKDFTSMIALTNAEVEVAVCYGPPTEYGRSRFTTAYLCKM